MSKHQQIDLLTKEIVDNLVQQKQFVDQYRDDIYREIENIRTYIADLLQQKIPKTTIVEYITKKYADIRGPTIINIEQTRNYIPRTETVTKNKSTTTKTQVVRRTRATKKRKIHTGPRGGRYFVTRNGKVYIGK